MKISFRSQLIYGFSIISAVLIVGFTYSVVSYQSNFLQKESISQAKNRSEAIAASSKVWLMSNDYIGLEEVIENFSSFKDTLFIAIINIDGKVLAHTDHTLIGKYVADQDRINYLKKLTEPTLHNMRPDELSLLKAEDSIDVLRVIHYKEQHLGFVHLRIDQKTFQENVYNTIFQGTAFTLLTILLSILFTFAVTNLFMKQLLHLLKVMKAYREGETHVQADENVVEEIAELASEFNDLMETLNTSQQLILQLNERQKLALSANNDGIWDWNLLDDTVYFSPRWKEILGYAEDEIGNSLSEWESRVHPDDLESTLFDVQKNIDGKTEYYENIHRLRHKDGHWVWVLDRGKTLFENNKPVRMLGTHTDITKEKEKQLEYAKQALIMNQIHDSVISTDIEGTILSWNKGSEIMLGYSKEEAIGKNISMIFTLEDEHRHEEYLRELSEQNFLSVDTQLVTKDKERLAVISSLSLVKDENEQKMGLIYISQDISKRKQAEKELLEQKVILEFQAHHDSLTGLYNRALFKKNLEKALFLAKEQNTSIALLFIDLDNFKEINDSLGHATGDRVLISVAQRLKHLLTNNETLARLGGDEFIIMLENIQNSREVSKLAQKIIHNLSLPMKFQETTLYVSCSIGISLYPNDGETLDNLMKYADSAMYKAKDEGRNNFQFYDVSMTELATKRVLIESALREALNNQEFLVYYQPQVNAKSGKLIGMEALVRWQHPTMGFLSPADFIPVAEATGLIVQLDRYVMRTAISQLVEWYKDGLNPGVLALNLTVQQIYQRDFIEMLRSTLQELECKPEWLELEVTESQIMKNPQEAVKILNVISAMGIELAIDDFGTGYSSLSYLKKLPLNKLKIDQSFVKDLPHNEHDIGITKTVIALAKSLNLSIIAEGVETQEQKDFLLESGCENVQGYFYSKPLPSEEMKRVLEIGLKV